MDAKNSKIRGFTDVLNIIIINNIPILEVRAYYTHNKKFLNLRVQLAQKLKNWKFADISFWHGVDVGL